MKKDDETADAEPAEVKTPGGKTAAVLAKSYVPPSDFVTGECQAS